MLSEAVLDEAYNLGLINKDKLAKGKLVVTKEDQFKKPGHIGMLKVRASQVADMYRTLKGLSDVLRYQIGQLPLSIGDTKGRRLKNWLIKTIGSDRLKSKHVGDLASFRLEELFERVSRHGSVKTSKDLDLFDRREQLRVLLETEIQVRRYVAMRVATPSYWTRRFYGMFRTRLSEVAANNTPHKLPFYYIANGVSHVARIIADPVYETHPEVKDDFPRIKKIAEEWMAKYNNFIPAVRERLNEYILYRAQVRTLYKLAFDKEMLKDKLGPINPTFLRSFARVNFPIAYKDGVFEFKVRHFENRNNVLQEMAEIRAKVGMRGWFKKFRTLKTRPWPFTNHFHRFVGDVEKDHAQMHRHLVILYEELKYYQIERTLKGWRKEWFLELQRELFDPFKFPTVRALNSQIFRVATSQWEYIDKRIDKWPEEVEYMDLWLTEIGNEKPLAEIPKPGLIRTFFAKHGRAIRWYRYRWGILGGAIMTLMHPVVENHVVDPTLDTFYRNGHYLMRLDSVDESLRWFTLKTDEIDVFADRAQFYLVSKHDLAGFHDFMRNPESFQSIPFSDYLNSFPEVREDWLRLNYQWERTHSHDTRYDFKLDLESDKLKNWFLIHTYRTLQVANDVNFLYDMAKTDSRDVLAEYVDAYLVRHFHGVSQQDKIKIFNWVKNVELDPYTLKWSEAFPFESDKYSEIPRLVLYHERVAPIIRMDLPEAEKQALIDTVKKESYYDEILEMERIFQKEIDGEEMGIEIDASTSLVQ
tara:strand:- start:681 stop:2945 length:2265 start_codon:yes stop_codon:yes gene_type:complete